MKEKKKRKKRGRNEKTLKPTATNGMKREGPITTSIIRLHFSAKVHSLIHRGKERETERERRERERDRERDRERKRMTTPKSRSKN